MLLDGFNHVALLTNDAARLHSFYEEVFDATVVREGLDDVETGPVSLTVVVIGPHSELNVFEVEGNTEADRQVPMFGRGRVAHLAVPAASPCAFQNSRER